MTTLWCLTYLHGKDFHPCFVVDGECRPDNSVDVHILWPTPGGLRCGTCSDLVMPEELLSMHFVAAQTDVPFSAVPIYASPAPPLIS